MRDINLKIMFIISFILRFFVCLALMNYILSFIYSAIFISLYYMFRKYRVGYIVSLVMLDYLLLSNICLHLHGASISTLVTSVIAFVSCNTLPYLVLINKIGKETSYKELNKNSNMYVDKGIKALEKEDIELAISEFESAIKSHKKNYLGYMGMCDALTRIDKKNLKKFKYYKKKCIKYAPENLKENIVKKYE